jgi:hypothetical protein
MVSHIGEMIMRRTLLLTVIILVAQSTAAINGSGFDVLALADNGPVRLKEKQQ